MGKTLTAEKSVQKSSREQAHVAENENVLGQPTTLHPLLRLQQTIGNQAVQRLLKSGVLQAKLKINEPGDQYEQEADRVSEEVMQSPDGVATGISDGSPNIQKKCKACAEEEEEVIQRKALASTVTPMIQRQEKEPEARSVTPSPGLIVDDEAEGVRPGQMRKSDFLGQLKSSVCSAAEEALSGTIWSAMGCPFIERWFSHYAEQDSQHVERALRKYAPEAASVRTAREYIPIVTQRVRRGIVQWAKTGEMTGVPEEFVKGGMPGATAAGLMGGLVSGALSAVGSAVSGLVRGAGRAISGIGRMLFKEREGGARETEDPEAIHRQLGSGYALEGSVKSRMESALGVDFSGVRIHTDATAQGLNDSLNARAFTIGSDIAFGSGEYQPGTPIGDAIIAHELAHVVQQGGGNTASTPMQKGGAEYNSLEEDADVSAVGAVVSVWGGVKGALKDIGGNAMPRLKSGIHLSRCATGSAAPKTSAATESPLKKRTEEPPREYFTADETAKSILAAAKDTTVDKKIRAVRAVEQIIDKYYPSHKEKVTKVVYDGEVETGLEVKPILGDDKKTYYGEIYVGEGFLANISMGKRFPHEVLRVGHEMEHIDQYRRGMAPPMRGKDKKKFEREFLAFYHEGIAVEVPHTGRLWRPTRVHIIDCALRYYYCLKPDDQVKYADHKSKLLKVRENEMKAINDPTKGFPEGSKPPPEAPSSCTLPPDAKTCEPKDE